MSKISNVIEVMNYLKINGIVKAQELADLLEIAPRQVRVYISDLKKSGLNIKSKGGKDGGYYLDINEEIPEFNLTNEEAFTFEDYLSRHSDTTNQQLRKAIYKEMVRLSLQKKQVNYISYIDKSEPNSNLNQHDKFISIINAIKKRISISFEYRKDPAFDWTEKKLNPFGLILYEGFYYLRAQALDGGITKTYKLVRMRNITEIQGTQFEIPSTFKIEKESAKYSLMTSEKFKLKLRIKSKEEVNSILESVWAEEQDIKEQAPGEIIFSGTMYGEKRIMKWILGMGSNVEVIAPIKIKKMHQEEVVKMYKKAYPLNENERNNS